MSHAEDRSVRSFLIDLYHDRLLAIGIKPEQVSDRFDFLTAGVIDSFGIIEMISALEAKFGQEIDLEGLDPESMTVLAPLSAYVEHQLQANPSGDDGADPLAYLRGLKTASVTIDGRKFEVWIANEPRSRIRGLMGVERHVLSRTQDGAERGMLFVFDREQPLSFWMHKTIVPLDIAYIDEGRTIINIHTGRPMETRLLYPSERPARYVLEVSGDVLQRLGIAAGSTVALPPSVATLS